MELRKHPKMRWHGRPNWPPEWNGPFGPDRPLPKGEVGTLVRAECRLGDLRTPHCYLDIQWNGQDYFGSLYLMTQALSRRSVISCCARLNVHYRRSAVWIYVCVSGLLSTVGAYNFQNF